MLMTHDIIKLTQDSYFDSKSGKAILISSELIVFLFCFVKCVLLKKIKICFHRFLDYY